MILINLHQVNEKNHRKLYRECNGDYGILAARLHVEKDRLMLLENRPMPSASVSTSLSICLLHRYRIYDEFLYSSIFSPYPPRSNKIFSCKKIIQAKSLNAEDMVKKGNLDVNVGDDGHANVNTLG